MDLKGLVSDPKFKALPPDRQAALLTEAGASPALITAITGQSVMSETPKFQQPLSIADSLPAGMREGAKAVGEYLPDLPSPETLTDLIPGIAGTVGAITTTPAGGAVAAGVGEGVRQGIRKSVGAAPATGFVQDQLGLDPNSPTAVAAGIAAETLGAGAMNRLGKFLGGTVAPKLRAWALKTYARGLAPGDTAAEAEMIKRLTPIQDDLPIGTRKRINRVAAEKARTAGEDVRSVYTDPANADTPASYNDAITRLRTARADPKIVAREATIDPITTPPTYVPPDIVDEPLYRAHSAQLRALTSAEYKGRLPDRFGMPQDITVQDLFNRRQSLGEQAKRRSQKAFPLGRPRGANLPPAVQALKESRAGVGDTLHSLTTTPVKAASGKMLSGKQADEFYNAWKSVDEGSPESTNILTRWLLARMIPGRMGTAAGAAASQGLLIRSLSAQQARSLAAALHAGDDQAALNIFRTAASALNVPNEE